MYGFPLCIVNSYMYAAVLRHSHLREIGRRSCSWYPVHTEIQFTLQLSDRHFEVYSLHWFWNSRVRLVLSVKVCFGDSVSTDKVNELKLYRIVLHRRGEQDWAEKNLVHRI